MQKTVSLLDCTLRDGGRIIDCAFADEDIKDITLRLTDSNIDIIEMGFLRDSDIVNYKENSTFFTDIAQISKFIPKDKKKVSFAVFIDYSMYNFDRLAKYDGTSIDSIRIGFKKSDYENDLDGIISACKRVKESGYKLYMQGVNSLSYTDIEFLRVIEIINNIKPHAFAIVDTYGAMYEDDFKHLYRLVNKNLDKDIKIAFHSHNNYQLSFSLAQKFIKLANETSREIIIDATLEGMGKCAGNLNLELIAEYLNRKYNYNYKIENIMDIIDDYMYNIKKNYKWGYSIPSVLAGIYQSHPNNVIYLTEKFRLATKEIKYILSMLPKDKRTKYDYDLIKELYIQYNHTKVDDTKTLAEIKNFVRTKNILILVPGYSIMKYKNKIKQIIEEKTPIIIPVNFITNMLPISSQLPFFGSFKRYQKFKHYDVKKIVVSNIIDNDKNDFLVNYESLIERDNENFDSSIIMLLNLLYRIDIENFIIAGFDGFNKNSDNYFDKKMFEDGRFNNQYEVLNKNTILMLQKYKNKLSPNAKIEFLTPSIFSKIFS